VSVVYGVIFGRSAESVEEEGFNLFFVEWVVVAIFSRRSRN
jgi:hypothetical protein